MQYPTNIKKGDTNGIPAPSDGANLLYIDIALQKLQNLGYTIKEVPHARNSINFVSAEAETRAKEWLQLWKNPSVTAMIAARGGDFLMDIIPYLHTQKEDIASHFKWMQGYSDISLLNYYITTNFDIATIHSHNIGSFAMKVYDRSIEKNLELLEGKLDNNTFVQNSYSCYQIEKNNDSTASYLLTEPVQYREISGLVEGEIKGRVLGGCLDVLVQLVGTPYDATVSFCKQYQKEGILWYFDNFDLSPMTLYRILMQLKNAGWFMKAKGFLFGRNFAPKEAAEFTQEEAIRQSLSSLQVPILCEVDISHLPPMLTIVNGANTTVTFQAEKAKIVQELT